MKIKLTICRFGDRKRLLLMIMRTFIFLLCTTVFSFNVENSMAQQRVTIDADKSVTIDEMFELIIDQTEFRFLYSEGLFKNMSKVQLKKGTIRVDKLLNQSIAINKFNIVLSEDNTILIKEKSKEQQKQVSGTVTDEAGLPLPGVVVLIKGTTTGVATNFDGTYSIAVSARENVLVFSYLGFKTQEITVGNQTIIDVVLKEELAELSEVLITGYQQLSKERSAGSFSKPEIATVRDRSTSTNILQRLDGLVPGLIINNAPNNEFGQGGGASITIRGLSTLNGERSPLLVVDGVPLSDVSSINPQDVEDITVLKDGTAASIWGARASNGVIVITTKKGGFNQKIKVDYDTYINLQGRPNIAYRPVLNSQQYIETARELFDPVAFPYANQSMYQVGTRENSLSVHNQILYDLDRGLINQTTADAMLNELANTNNVSQIEDLLYRNAIVNNHTLSVQGGGEKYAFYGSTAYTNTQSNSPGEGNENYKLNLRQDFKIGKRINFRLNTDITNTVQRSKRNINADNRFTPYALFRGANGNNLDMLSAQLFSNDQRLSLENQSGIDLSYTPLDDINTGYTKGNALSARLNGGLSVKLLKGLKYEGTYGYFHQNNIVERFDSEDSYEVRSDLVFFTVPGANPGDAPTYHLPSSGGYYRTSNNVTKNWTIRNQLSYDNAWNDGKHKLTILAGQESQEQLFSNRQTFIRGYNTATLNSEPLDYRSLSNGISGTLVAENGFGNSSISIATEPFNESETLLRFRSYYTNSAYTLNDKYTINASWRIDESNLFGKDKSAQNKPVWSVGAKWNLYKEAFLDEAKGLDQLALRVTYGITGNSPEPGGSASFDVLTNINALPLAFSAPFANEITAAGNKKLTWESTKNLNLGVDFGVFNNRISGSVDYYHRKTDDLLDRVFTNVFTGFSDIPGNSGSIENKGIELSLQTVNIDKAFKWNTGFIFGYNENEVTRLTNTNQDASGFGQVLSRFPQIGYSAFPVFAFDFAGLNDEGSPEIRLADGTIVSERGITQLEDLKYMGTYQPKWSGSFINTFSYGGFTLTANVIYNLGHVMFVDTPSLGAYSGQPLEGGAGNFTAGNVHADFANRWRQAGDENSTNIPAYLAQPNAINRDINYFKYAVTNVTSASYIKLRDISLSYVLPSSITDKINIDQIRLRAQMNNIMLWKDNDKGIDPEFHDAIGGLRATSPFNQNAFTLGLHLTF